MAKKRVHFRKAFRLNLVDKMTGVRSQMQFTPGYYDLDEEIANHWFVKGIQERDAQKKAGEPEVKEQPTPTSIMTARVGTSPQAQATLAKAQAQQAKLVVPAQAVLPSDRKKSKGA